MIGPRARRGVSSAMAPIAAPEWLVCMRRGRAIADGLVVCPAGFYMPWTRCLLCPELETTQHDRRLQHLCVAGGLNLDAATEDVEPVNWGELIVELL
jgi:hypothetical protein